ncbi:hypothetical protein AMTR_s00167p00042130 [Amborella trichopoda]|uniref:Uncharacterized protein n=1 Tax=Amborella trichopoda TaxID=13333 RepID=W1PS65_AMBTC|nr:hypothetical protein AMTR_s00167p00042130 [Amborella trichopoda]
MLSPARPAVSVLLALEATQEEVRILSAHPSGSPVAQSSDSPASGGPLGNNPLGFCTASDAMTPFASRVLDVLPLDVIGFSSATRLSFSSKVFMVKRMLHSGLQELKGCSLSDLGERMEAFKACVSNLRGAWPDGEIFDRLDGLLQNLSDWGSEALSCEAHPRAGSACFGTGLLVGGNRKSFGGARDYEGRDGRTRSLGGLTKFSSGFQLGGLTTAVERARQLDSDYAAVVDLVNLTAQKISGLQEEK